MGTSNIEISILKKRLELLEMKIEERLYVVKEMLTTEEASKYLGISQSQIYKLTMNMQIPHFKPKGKTIYFNRQELLRWMRKNHVVPAKQKK